MSVFRREESSAYPAADPPSARPTHVVGPGGDHTTIGDAARAADPGDRILVHAGLYEEREPVDPRTPEVESLMDELVDIGNGRGFITVKSRDQRTRQIGSSQVRRPARELDVAWHGVGDWRG